MAAKRTPGGHVAALIESLGADVAIGSNVAHNGIEIDGYGEPMVADVVVVIRRRVSTDERMAWRAAAMDELRREPFRSQHCACYVDRAGYTRSSECRNEPRAVVVVKRPFADPYRLFVCSTHKRSHGVDAPCVLSVVDLVPADVRQIAEEYKRKRDAESRRQWAVEDLADHVVNCPVCGASTLDDPAALRCPEGLVREKRAASAGVTVEDRKRERERRARGGV